VCTSYLLYNCFVLIDAYCGLCGLCFVCACALCLGGCGPFYAITIANEKLKGHSILGQQFTDVELSNGLSYICL